MTTKKRRHFGAGTEEGLDGRRPAASGVVPCGTVFLMDGCRIVGVGVVGWPVAVSSRGEHPYRRSWRDGWGGAVLGLTRENRVIRTTRACVR